LRGRSSPLVEVLRAFSRLGVSGFGGPVAHLGYFRNEFVVRRRWLGETAYAEIVGLCQFLPGPASSQVAFSLGLRRAGYLGGIAAWLGFTLPSAIALVLFAYGASALRSAAGIGLLHGLNLVAVAIVAQAVWGMARTLCPDRERASIAALAALVMLLARSAASQVGAILLGALAGLWLCRATVTPAPERASIHVSRRTGVFALLAFFCLLVGLPLLATRVAVPGGALLAAVYRCGALVFGGGHVVLPLLREAVVTPGWVTDEAFLAGYGAAQAVPGPLFTFAAYLGAVANTPPGGVAGAVVGLLGIFLPGILILVGTLPFWEIIRRQSAARGMISGVNAAVVGLLAAALYDPVWTSAIKSVGDLVVAVVGIGLLAIWRVPPLIIVVVSAAGGVLLAVLAR
jgi:chromate transporter